MKRFSVWAVTLALGTGLTAGLWAQHGGVHGGVGHDPHEVTSEPRAGAPASSNFVNRLSSNTHLANRLQSLLPPGEKLQGAAMGFKNQGQFIAALHVAHNLNISFDSLKAEMTGPGHDSLGEAIHDLRPDLTTTLVKNNVKLAHNQTKTDLEESKEPAETASN